MPENEGVPRRTLCVDPGRITAPERAPFVELGLVSCFTFLRGASDTVDLVKTAYQRGYDAIGIADANTMAGVVRIHTEAKKLKLRPIIGCRIETVEGLSFLAYPRDRVAYGRLCRLISAGRRATLDDEWQEKGVCEINLAMLAEHSEGVHLILIPPPDLEAQFTIAVPSTVVPFTSRGQGEDFERIELSGSLDHLLPHLAVQFPTLRHIAASFLHLGDDIARIERLDALAQMRGLSILATNDVHYATPDKRPLQDVMTAIRYKTTVARAGPLLHGNAERYLKPPETMVRLFERWPHAIAAARAVADACTFSLDELQYEYPQEAYSGGISPQRHLENQVWKGAKEWRYPKGLPSNVRKTLERELALIAELDLARYFLTIKDIVDYARGRDILCQGRGSAANSAVCFCLGITSVDPARHQLLFDRFISKERREPPDIDVDFEHERREEVIQHIYEHYGRDRAGLCATVIHYRPRMAVREVGKAMGLTEDVTALLARTVWGGHGRTIDPEHVRRETGLDLTDPHLRRVLALTEQMIGMPRHLSQHVGGFILTDGPLTETVPIGNGAMPERSFIEWDKDDIDELGIMKVDVLALGMLTCIRKCLHLLRDHHDRELGLADVPAEDSAVYDMLCKGDSLGVFQVESRAQMNMLPRLRPREFYDLVVQVAIVRPGPIQGDMVHPYLKQRRLKREGKTDFTLPSPAPEHGPPDELSSILRRTYGVPIFQEQAMKIALDAAKFSPEEANQLRKAMATFRSRGMVNEHQDKMVGRMIARGYDPVFAERCFNQIKGFGEYGFPESHAASFAHLVYVSSWLKCHYPAAFACGLLNSQPMGFYAPAQIVRDAREHGVEVLPPDVNLSNWDCTLEKVDGAVALRLGLRQIDGLPEGAAAELMRERQARGPYRDLHDLHDRARIQASYIERLASADACGSLGLSRRQALWDARSLVTAPDLPLFRAAAERDEGAERRATMLPVMPLSEEVVADYQTTRLSLKAHPMSFLREELDGRGFVRASDLRSRKFRSVVQVAGVVLIRQQPGSAKGVCFITLEDETGVVNLVVWPDVKERQRKVVMGARMMEVRGRVEYDDEVIHVIAHQMTDATHQLSKLSDDLLQAPLARADHVKNPLPGNKVNPRDNLREGADDPYTGAQPVEPWQEPPPGNRDCGYHGPQGGGHPRNVRVIPKSRDFH
ncbi:DNA polymerase III subunit alpha [Erythrobacter sp. 3-20A1M]|uniref:error-prone DNA polymerase n=1 Tax=Erythrobacter sp. 3-20A1M TaxID=2653850 RepID=UPI001BFC7090|nr:error-prone DNA polymerase [Erythrobacter sp. 3-20A1M]QWC58046.1 DNA polymerase III subunit alpha [Erythrobacter sp. 3-20A1M]